MGIADGTDSIDGVIDRLTYEFAGVYSVESIAEVVHSSHAQLASARLQAFVPLLTYRYARERLRAAALTSGRLDKVVPEVLFVCVHNAGRSQMAAALLTAKAGGAVTVRSAGTQPGEQVHPVVIEVLAEIGLDTSDLLPLPLSTESVEAADVIVTMGCGDACPVLPGHRYLDWDLPDPAGQDLSVVRSIRDHIDTLVTDLLQELTEETDRHE